ncbi:MAG: cation:proton antiporter [Polyangiaceae bacterium]
MPHETDLILTLVGGLGAALVLGFITQKMKLSPIVGYLLAGIAVGPFTPGFVAHSGLASQAAEIGIILLMFGVGVNFHVHELLAVKKVAIPGAFAGIFVATGLGVVVAHFTGWTLGAGVVFGLTIAIASTVVLIRVLADHDALQTPAGHVAVGWLVVEDLFTVLVLVLLPLLAGPKQEGSVFVSVGIALVKVGALIAFVLVGGKRLIPALLGYVAETKSRELFTLTVLVLALGIAVASAKLFGASMALGAFLGGIAVGQSDFGSRAGSDALPMRDAFAVLFFVSVGMLFDPSQFTTNLALTVTTVAVVLIGKPLAAFIVVKSLNYPVKMAVSIAAALAQIGEFSFVVAAVGKDLGVLPDRATQALVVTSMVTITLNPILFRSSAVVARWLAARSPKEAPSGESDAPRLEDEERYRAIVVGYGPVGKTVTRLLRENEIAPTVIELNHETIATLRADGVRAIYGDAAQQEILEKAGVRSAVSLIFAASGSAAANVIRMAKDMNPRLRILARATYVHEIAAVKAAGADTVISSETEIALAMTERILTALGATPDQLDRAREKTHSELNALRL